MNYLNKLSSNIYFPLLFSFVVFSILIIQNIYIGVPYTRSYIIALFFSHALFSILPLLLKKLIPSVFKYVAILYAGFIVVQMIGVSVITNLNKKYKDLDCERDIKQSSLQNIYKLYNADTLAFDNHQTILSRNLIDSMYNEMQIQKQKAREEKSNAFNATISESLETQSIQLEVLFLVGFNEIIQSVDLSYHITTKASNLGVRNSKFCTDWVNLDMCDSDTTYHNRFL